MCDDIPGVIAYLQIRSLIADTSLASGASKATWTSYLQNLSTVAAGKIRFAGARKSVLLKASSGERSAPRNFVHLVTWQGMHVRLIMYLVVHQMKYVTERWSNAIIFCNFLMKGLKAYPKNGNPDFASHSKLYMTWLWL